MLLQRKNFINLYNLILQKKAMVFTIETQYKLLKLKQIIESELDIYQSQIQSLLAFCETDEQGNIIQENNRLKIKQECLVDCEQTLSEINNMQVQFPDIYFSLDELEPLGLTLEELELLEPFIKI